MKKWNVLILPAGTEVGREIYRSLMPCKEVALFLGGAQYNNHAMFLGEEYHLFDSVSEPDWLAQLNAFIATHQIDAVFPAHDDVTLALSQHQQEIAATVIAPSYETCHILRYKSLTYQAIVQSIAEPTVAMPKVYNAFSDIHAFPVFIKPDRGQGSQGASIAHTEDELRYLAGNITQPIICEYLPGDEFTVDCFSDREKGVLFCQARTRERVRSGITMASKNVALENIHTIASELSQALAMRGAWFFQVKYSADNRLTLLEIAPRIAGTMALNRVRGINFALLSLYEHARMPLNLLLNSGDIEISRGLENRYTHRLQFDDVYIDFDDTLVINGNVYLPLISFIFQCLNQKKRVHLITRHSGNLAEALASLRLNLLFDSTIHITDGTPKSAHIDSQSAIFIDDSFSERVEVHRKLGIPTFDNSMVPLLVSSE